MRLLVLWSICLALLSNDLAMADDDKAATPAASGNSDGSGDPICCSNDFIKKLFQETRIKRGGSGDPKCCTNDDIIHILEAHKRSLTEQRQKIDQAIDALKAPQK
jgi:hypothetical protein